MFAQIPLERGYVGSTISFDLLTDRRFRSSFGLVLWVDSLFNDHDEAILVTEKDFEVNLLLVRYKSNVSLINRFQELQVLKSIFRFLFDSKNFCNIFFSIFMLTIAIKKIDVYVEKMKAPLCGLAQGP